MKGVILAAGKGTRLYPITRHIAKPLLPIANRPTLHYAFDRLREVGIEDICLVVGENEAQMMDALGDGSSLGIRLTYVRQAEPKGLAHAVSFAKEFVGSDSFCLYLGDAMYSDSLAPFARRYEESGCANLNLVKWVPDPSRFGVANLDGERIVKLVEKPSVPESNYAMAGLYFFGPQIWSVLPGLQPSERGEFEITDAIQTLINQGQTVLAGVYEGAWFDTGTLDSFLETTAHLIGEDQLVAEDAHVLGGVGHSVVIGAGAHVSCGVIENSVVLPGSHIRVGGHIRRCILAGRVEADGDLEDQIRWGDSSQ
ncbi:MAG: NTP transferase domain-containing protein [Chlorobia bacterium]|nr:NTP transferase domain-containing protein [Fimbriimonadaceae bacterium]